MTAKPQPTMSSKRKRDYAAAATTPSSSPSAKICRFVYKREQDSCWLCGLIGVCVVPIIAQTDAALVRISLSALLLRSTDDLMRGLVRGILQTGCARDAGSAAGC